MALELWQRICFAAESSFAEEMRERGPVNERELAREVANDVLLNYLHDARSYAAFIEDDTNILWRAMENKSDCETIADAIFDMAENDLYEFIVDKLISDESEEENA